jgi:hypothetical protein
MIVLLSFILGTYKHLTVRIEALFLTHCQWLCGVHQSGFGNAFYMMAQPDLLSPEPGDPIDNMEGAFGTLSASFLSLFSALTGAYDFGILDGFNLWSLLIILYLIYIVVNAIVLLNLLITVGAEAELGQKAAE